MEEARHDRSRQSVVFSERSRHEAAKWDREEETGSVVDVITRAKGHAENERAARRPTEWAESRDAIAVHENLFGHHRDCGHDDGHDQVELGLVAHGDVVHETGMMFE